MEKRPPLHKVVLLATRPNTLTLSLTPVVVGTALSGRATPSSLWFWLFACLIQIGTNLHNDYADFVKGADTKDRVGQARATQKGWLTAGQTAGSSAFSLVAAAAIGAYLARTPGCGRFMSFVTATSVFNAVAYTGGPFPLGYVGLGWVSIGYSGLGDVFVLAYFGYVATIAPYLLNTSSDLGSLPAQLLIVATALGSLATGVLVVNNLRDAKTDVLVNKRTLAVRFGESFARSQYVVVLTLPYALIFSAVVFDFAPAAWLLALVTAPLAVREISVETRYCAICLIATNVFHSMLRSQVSQVRAVLTKEGGDLNPYVGGTAK